MSDILAKHGQFVNEQYEYNAQQASRHGLRGDTPRQRSYEARAIAFRELIEDLEALSAELLGPSDSAPNLEHIARLTPDEVRDLPPELLKELSISDSDRKDYLIVDLIEAEGGVTSIDRLLIQIYKRTHEIEKRTRLVSRLYRMTNKGFVFPHPQRKGIYGLKPFPGQDSAQPTLEGAEDLLDDTEGGNDLA